MTGELDKAAAKLSAAKQARDVAAKQFGEAKAAVAQAESEFNEQVQLATNPPPEVADGE